VTSAYCTPADVLARLRLAPDHPDAAYVADCTTVACELIDDRLAVLVDDVLTPPAPPYPRHLWRAAVSAAVDVYRNKDRDSDTAGSWANGTAAAPPPRIPNDVLERVDALLAPARHVWGIG
jgi:hypothetical protein